MRAKHGMILFLIVVFVLSAGVPAFSQADKGWSTFGLGLDGEVHALKADGNGNLYVGGTFSKGNGVPLSNIARWNGADWETPGGGVNGTVYAIELVGDDVYVAGNFRNAVSPEGDTLALTRNIARWDGEKWRRVGVGSIYAEDTIYALEYNNGILYAGGNFSMPNLSDLTTIQNFAQWNGLEWKNPGAVSGTILALEAGPFGLLLGGEFSSTEGGNGTAHVAVLFGDEIMPLGLGTSGPVRGIAAVGANIYVGGTFTSVFNADGAEIRKGPTSMGIARWDGEQWHTLDLFLRGKVNTLEAGPDGNVYVAGSFVGIEDAALAGDLVIPSKNVVCWTGAEWQAVAQGVSSEVFAVEAEAASLWVGGEFAKANDIDGGFTERADVYSSNIARWAGFRWNALGYGVNNEVAAIVDDPLNENAVYIGGRFKLANAGSVNQHVNRVAHWDEATRSWTALGYGVTLRSQPADRVVVYDLAVHEGNIYAGGNFDVAMNERSDSLTANRIARWDGKGWHSLAGGLGNIVYAMVSDGSSLYAGGAFTEAYNPDGETIDVYGIARWDGERWHALDGGVSGTVYALALGGTELFVGGTFDDAGVFPNTTESPGIVRWDGSGWNPVGQGMREGQSRFNNDPIVKAILVDGASVYAGGDFLKVLDSDGSEVEVNHIARWDGSSWHALKGGIDTENFNADPLVEDITLHKGVLYIAGTFDRVGHSVQTKGLGQWDGDSWHAIGGGLNAEKGILPTGNIIHVNDKRLIIGGEGTFSDAGGYPAPFLAQWNEISGSTTPVWEPAAFGRTAQGHLQADPNPFSSATVLRYTLASAGMVDIALFNSLGEHIASPVHSTFHEAGGYSLNVNLSEAHAVGVLYCRLSINGQTQATSTLVVQR